MSVVQIDKSQCGFVSGDGQEGLVDDFRVFKQSSCTGPAQTCSESIVPLYKVQKEFRALSFDGLQANYSHYRFELERCFARYPTLTPDEKLNLLFDSLAPSYRLRFAVGLSRPYSFQAAFDELNTEFCDRRKVRQYIRLSFETIVGLPKEPTSGQLKEFLDQVLLVKFGCRYTVDLGIIDTFLEVAMKKLPYWLQFELGDCQSIDEFVSRIGSIVSELPSDVPSEYPSHEPAQHSRGEVFPEHCSIVDTSDVVAPLISTSCPRKSTRKRNRPMHLAKKEKNLSSLPSRADDVDLSARWDPPKDFHGLRVFLGRIRRVRQTIPDSSRLLTPFYDLLRNHHGFCWTDKCDKAFSDVKNAMIRGISLAGFDQKLETAICVDSSIDGISAVLKQKHGHEWKPVSYFSRGLDENEWDFDASQLELLSISLAVSYWQHLLCEDQFSVYAD